jgi:hypothetical protein
MPTVVPGSISAAASCADMSLERIAALRILEPVIRIASRILHFLA